MDSLQIIKYSLMSKIMNDNTITHFFSNYLYLYIGAFIYIIYQIIPIIIPQNVKENWIDTISEYVKHVFPICDKDESSINIPTHKKTYYTHNRSVASETVKTIFSLRFKSLNYYLQDKKYDEISSLVEIIKIENDIWGFEQLFRLFTNIYK